MPLFRFRIVKKFRDTLSRQIAESTRIDLRRNVLNSKTVYSRNRLPRLEVERTEWEKEDEEKRKRILAWKEREKLQEEQRREEEDILKETRAKDDEVMVAEAWRGLKTSRNREEKREEDLKCGERPSKRVRMKRQRQEKDTMWGQSPLTEEEEGRESGCMMKMKEREMVQEKRISKKSWSLGPG